MKNLLILLSSIFIISCTDQREKIIADYEEKFDGVKTDLDFKMIKFKEVKPFMVKDSILAYKDSITKYKQFYENIYKNLINTNLHDIEYYKQMDYKVVISGMEKRNEEYKLSIEKLKNGDFKCCSILLDFEHRLNKIMAAPEDSILLNVVEATFSITNPFLNNARQEFTRTYYFTSDNLKILNVEDKK